MSISGDICRPAGFSGSLEMAAGRFFIGSRRCESAHYFAVGVWMERTQILVN